MNEQDLVKELQSLSEQRAKVLGDLHQIAGAEKMVRHLLTKTQEAKEQAKVAEKPAEPEPTPAKAEEPKPAAAEPTPAPTATPAVAS